MDLKAVLARMARDACNVLSIGQRGGDWFILRQFSITKTTAGKIHLSNVRLLEVMGRFRDASVAACERLTLKMVLSDLCRSWISPIRSTEDMMRGTLNEETVFAAVKIIDFVKAVFEVGMLGDLLHSWLAAPRSRESRVQSGAPDGVALLDVCKL